MDVKKTITSIFMIPTLKFPKDSLKQNGFINGYMKDERKDTQYEDAVYILFQPNNLDKFREFLDVEYERKNHVIEDYDYEEGFVIVVCKLNSKFKKDFNLIKEGKYSKTSKAFQDLFPKSVKIVRNGVHKDELSLQLRIFKKTEDLREFWEDKLDVTFDEDYEVWDGWDEQKEVLNLDKLKEYVQSEVS
jgi:hypothetical protein